jgi:hypothetical protein
VLALLLDDKNLGGLYVDHMPKKIAKKQHTAATEKRGD